MVGHGRVPAPAAVAGVHGDPLSGYVDINHRSGINDLRAGSGMDMGDAVETVIPPQIDMPVLTHLQPAVVFQQEPFGGELELLPLERDIFRE